MSKYLIKRKLRKLMTESYGFKHYGNIKTLKITFIIKSILQSIQSN